MKMETLYSFVGYTYYNLTVSISTLLICVIIYTTVSTLYKRSKLPPGPFPLPIFGNLLNFAGETPALTTIQKYYKRYGNVCTLWFGSEPHIIISSWALLKDALITRKDDFSGRATSRIKGNIIQDGHDVIFSDISQTHTILKKMGYAAIRKYIITPKFVEVTYDHAMDLVSNILNNNEPFDPDQPLYDMVFNIMEFIAFGDGEKDSKNVYTFRKANKTLEEKVGNGLPSDYIKFLAPFFWRTERAIKTVSIECLDHVKIKLHEHQSTFKKDDIRDFVDAILASKEEADECDKPSITDENIALVIFNLFLATVGTTHQFLSWLILHIANDPEIQNRVYKEISDNIGDRMAVPKDKDTCPYTSAVFSEILRLQNLLPLLLPHKTMCNTTIGNYKIPKGIAVLFNIASIHFNEEIWKEPHIFKPERFLNSEGNYTSERLTDYAPFGLGRRSCPGEKMARADIFIIFVTIMQNCEISLENGPGTANFTPKDTVLLTFTQPYKIVVKKRQ